MSGLLFRLDPSEQLARTDDRPFAKTRQSEEVMITRNNDIGITGKCGFKHTVVSKVLLDDSYLLFRLNYCADPAKERLGLVDCGV